MSSKLRKKLAAWGFSKSETASASVSSITNIVISAVLIGTIGVIGLSYLVNTTYLAGNGITGTNATIFGVIAIMTIVSFMAKMAPKGK